MHLTNLVDVILRAKKPCILAVKDVKNKIVSIHILNNLAEYLSRTITVHSTNLVYEILEYSPDKFLALHHFSLYKNDGWKIETQVPIKVKLGRKLVEENGKLTEIVYLSTSRNNKLVLGIFYNVSQSNQFIETLDVNFPVMANNFLTREYYRNELMRKAKLDDLLK